MPMAGASGMSASNSFAELVSIGQVFARWPQGYATKTTWKYDEGRLLKKGASPSFVHIDGKEIPVFHISQTKPMPKLSGLELAKFEFMRRFWVHARHDRYLLCDDKTSTIDWKSQQLAGRKAPYFDERLVEQHLQGKKVYGLFAEESFRSRPSRTPWLAIDLDLHLKTGGNLSIFKAQLEVLLDRLWGKHFSQLAVSDELVNGVHLYLYLPVLQSLDGARRWLATLLNDLHTANPELAEKVDQWNQKLKLTDKNWKVRQVNDLEIYPHERHGFRFIGAKGKVLLAHKPIGLTTWGFYKQGKKKGQPKIGFDLEAWWESLQTDERMPLEEVLDFVNARLPSDQPAFPEAVQKNSPASLIMPTEETKVESSQVTASPAAAPPPSFKGQTRKLLTDYWLGKRGPGLPRHGSDCQCSLISG